MSKNNASTEKLTVLDAVELSVRLVFEEELNKSQGQRIYPWKLEVESTGKKFTVEVVYSFLEKI